MKTFQLLLLFLQIEKICSRKKSTKRPEWHFIDNWDKYHLPKPVHERDLAAILGKIARYKNLKYCPFEDPYECRRENMDEVVKRIIEVNTKYSDDYYTGKPDPCFMNKDKQKGEKNEKMPLASFGGRDLIAKNSRFRG